MIKTPPTNIAAYLPDMAGRQPDTPAIHCPVGQDGQGRIRYVSLTFQELEQQSNRAALGLEAAGIGRGVRTVLMVSPGPEFFALTFALFKVGAIPVLVDPGMGVKNLKVCLAEAQPQAFIGLPKAHLARVLLGWAKDSLKILVTVGRRFGWGGTTLETLMAAFPADAAYAMAQPDREETAAILFTSGSTGVPKGAVYSHGNFLAQVEALQRVYSIQPGEVDLPTFPLFALFAPALGMSSVIPDMDFTRPASVDPEKIIAAVQQFKVTNMFGSPALINRVGRYGAEQGTRLPSLRRVISAGAPVPANVLARFAEMLGPETQIFTPYGATESLPVCSIGSREILDETRTMTDAGKGVCVGLPVPGIQVEVIRISDAPIVTWSDSLKVSPGEIGEIVVKGPQVTASYFNRDESTRLAKIADPEHGGFFHRMGDLGYCDGIGRFWFCGRKSHRVITANGDLFTIPCEAIFNTHPKVFRTALVGVGESGQQRPVLCVELEQGTQKSEQEQIRQQLFELGQGAEITRSIEQILFHPAFPVDIRHNAKIFREKLAVWAARETA